jgi:hypothetical protein
MPAFGVWSFFFEPHRYRVRCPPAGFRLCLLWKLHRCLPHGGTDVQDRIRHASSGRVGRVPPDPHRYHLSLLRRGMRIGTQLLTRFARHIPQQDLVVYGLGGMGIAVLTTAAFGTMGSTAAGMLGLGLCASAIFITATTLIQHETPHELLGRVMSCLMSLVAGSQVISMFVAGPVAEKIGIPNLYYGSAAMLVGIGVVGYFKLPKAEKAEAEKAESAKTG